MILGSVQLGSIDAQLGAIVAAQVAVNQGDEVTTMAAYFRRTVTATNTER